MEQGFGNFKIFRIFLRNLFFGRRFRFFYNKESSGNSFAQGLQSLGNIQMLKKFIQSLATCKICAICKNNFSNFYKIWRRL